MDDAHAGRGCVGECGRVRVSVDSSGERIRPEVRLVPRAEAALCTWRHTALQQEDFWAILAPNRLGQGEQEGTTPANQRPQRAEAQTRPESRCNAPQQLTVLRSASAAVAVGCGPSPVDGAPRPVDALEQASAVPAAFVHLNLRGHVPAPGTAPFALSAPVALSALSAPFVAIDRRYNLPQAWLHFDTHHRIAFRHSLPHTHSHTITHTSAHHGRACVLHLLRTEV